jgi:hypothetical protein
MASNYSVIQNPSTPNVLPELPRRQVEHGDARRLIAGRQMVVLGNGFHEAAPFIDATTSGMVLTGKHAASRVRRLKDEYRNIPLLIEPYSVEHHTATPDEPFLLPADDGGFFPMTLDAALDVQRGQHASIAMTPTGQIGKGDSASLKAALRDVEQVGHRSDTLFLLVLAAGWLSDPQLVKQVIAVINRSPVPVALAFVGTTNPVGSLPRLRAYRRIFVEVTQLVVPYRADLVAFDARAHGAPGSVVGLLPAMRRVTTVGKGGGAADPTDLAPHMLIGDLLRFARSKMMRNEWFADAASLICNCLVCQGRPIDRLYENETDRREGHLHNALELQRLHAMTIGMTPSQTNAWWHTFAAGALDTYPRLESHLGRALKIPADVEFWASDRT